MNITARAFLIPTFMLLAASPALASWDLSTVATTDVSHVSQNLFISDSGGQIQRIVYHSASSGFLRLATRINTGSGWGSWSIRNVDEDSATHNAIAVSSIGIPFIAYHETSNRNLYLTWLNACFFPSCASTWPSVRIDGVSNNDDADYGTHVSLMLVEDDNGNITSIHAASVMNPDSGYSKVRYSRCMTWPDCDATSDWIREDVPMSTAAEHQTGITGRIDSAGNTNVDIYASIWNGGGPQRGLHRARWGSIAGGVWSSTELLSGHYGNLSVKKMEGGPILVTIGTNTRTYFGTSPNFFFSQVSADGEGGPFADAIIDELGVPVVAFLRNITDDLLIARQINGEWVRETVVSADVVGHNAQIAEDIDGDYLIPYRNATTNRLMLATGD